LIKIAVNGFGRIGKNFLYFYLCDKNKNFEIDRINDIADIKSLIHLYNVSKPDATVDFKDGIIRHENLKIPFTSTSLEQTKWDKTDVVIESTGAFFRKDDAGKHNLKGARYTVISSPSTEADITLIKGINENEFSTVNHKLISASSCTAQAALPIAHALKPLGILKMFFSTIHPYTVNNKVQDMPGRNLRESRSALQSIIPARTRAGKGFLSVLPDTKMAAYSFKVPLSRVACLDTVINTERGTTKNEVNSLLKKYAAKNSCLLNVTQKPLVSSGFTDNPISSVADENLTQVLDNLVRVFSWYDNEYAYSHKLYKLAKYIASKI
jgi:glyceraldehyde-3-phosphate dehydrogenase type I